MPKKSIIREKLLKLLSEGGEVPQSLLPRLLNASKSRISEVLKILDAEGLIIKKKIGNQYLISLKKEYQISLKKEWRKVLRIAVVWSSEYPFLTTFAKKLSERNLKLRLSVYPSAIEATTAAIRGEAELVLAPLITELYVAVWTRNLRIIGGGATGGAYILKHPEVETGVVISSKLSTMDALRAVAIKEGEVPAERTFYFSKPDELIKSVKRKEVEYAVVWHPLTKKLVNLGMKKIHNIIDYDFLNCCTLAVNTSLSPSLRALLGKIYEASLEEFSKNPKRWIEWYSLNVGINPQIVSDAWAGEYRVSNYVDRKYVEKLLNRVGISIPSTSTYITFIQKE
ncbi:MAG: hypothetical protein DRO10_00520 [Thermoprotei archaeon]|nr:MAG: hypothetical protein DRO10_00520 [Thermoprotei archaeon]